MIQSITIHQCRDCQSTNIVKNGFNVYGNQQYQCKDCGASKVLQPTVKYTEERKEEVLKAYQERSSLRGVARIFGISRKTVTGWLKNPDVASS